MHLLVDYLVLVAAPAKITNLTDLKDWPSASGDDRGAGEISGDSLPREAWRKLRQGAYALYGACSKTEVCHLLIDVHTVRSQSISATHDFEGRSGIPVYDTQCQENIARSSLRSLSSVENVSLALLAP